MYNVQLMRLCLRMREGAVLNYLPEYVGYNVHVFNILDEARILTRSPSIMRSILNNAVCHYSQ